MFEQAKELIKNIKIEKDFRISVSRQNKNIASIRPITFYDVENDALIQNLMNWRNENIEAYMDHTLASFEGTRKWLKKYILDNETKLLFLVYSEKNIPIGHMGLADGMQTDQLIEMDNIVRGIKKGNKGIMTLALHDLISWVFLSMEIKKVYLRVFSNNPWAIQMYERLNFKEKKKLPLDKDTHDGVTKYFFSESKKISDTYMSYMELNRSNHLNNSEKSKDVY